MLEEQVGVDDETLIEKKKREFLKIKENENNENEDEPEGSTI